MTSSDNNFNDFSENQLTIDFAFPLQAYLGECYCITIPPCPDIIWGNGIPPKYLGGTAFP